MGVYTASPVGNREKLLQKADNLPPFSPILKRLLATLSREDVRFGAVSELIEKDTVIAGNLLRLVNSALYGLAGTINSVRHGLSIIGIEKARNMVLMMSLSRFWRQEPAVQGWSSAAFNLHSTATAILSDLLIEYVPVEYPEGAFTAGLFHDLGKLLAATALPAEFNAARIIIDGGVDDFEECEKNCYGITHSELSAAALEHWNLPEPIARAVRSHHAPQKGRDERAALSTVVQAADRLANRLGVGLAPSRPFDRGAPEEVLEALGLDEGRDRLLQEFDAEFEVTRSLF
jgi:HD-like signal output (HDOD) protein